MRYTPPSASPHQEQVSQCDAERPIKALARGQAVSWCEQGAALLFGRMALRWLRHSHGWV